MRKKKGRASAKKRIRIRRKWKKCSQRRYIYK